MNVFGVGGWELVLVLLIMLVVAGPRRMAQWAYILGQWTAKARSMWAETMAVIQAELDEAGVDVKLPKTPPTRASIERSAKDFLKPVVEPLEEVSNELKQDINAVSSDLQGELKDLDKSLKGTGATAAGSTAAALRKKPSSSSTNGNGAAQAGAPDSAPGSPNPPATDDPPKPKSDFGTWGGSNTDGDE